MYPISEQLAAALEVTQGVIRENVELAEGAQALRLDAEIAESDRQVGSKEITRGRRLTRRIERIAQSDLEPLTDPFGNRSDLDRSQFLARGPGLGVAVERRPAAPA